MRRLVLLSLTAAGVLATAAIAQEQPAPPPPAETAPAAPEAAAPAEPAAEPAAPAAEPEAPPAPPTDVTSLTVLNLVDKICMPLVRGGDLARLAPPLGFKKKRDLWVLQYTKGYKIVIPPTGVNKDVCTLEIDHPIETIAPAATLATDLHNWARGRGWYLKRFDKFVTDMERTTRTWESEGLVGGETETLVLMTERKIDGRPASAKADHSELLYSVQQN